jgi:Fe2+ or Zn2+ uptake regulation protein
MGKEPLKFAVLELLQSRHSEAFTAREIIGILERPGTVSSIYNVLRDWGKEGLIQSRAVHGRGVEYWFSPNDNPIEAPPTSLTGHTYPTRSYK